jgi:hypothetical protein
MGAKYVPHGLDCIRVSASATEHQNAIENGQFVMGVHTPDELIAQAGYSLS